MFKAISFEFLVLGFGFECFDPPSRDNPGAYFEQCWFGLTLFFLYLKWRVKSTCRGETSSTQGVCDCLSVSSPASREPSGQLSGVLQHDLGRALTSKEMPGRTSSTTPATVSKLPAAPTAGQYNLIVPLKSVAMSLDGHLGTVTLSAESIHISYDNSRCFMVEGGAEDGACVVCICIGNSATKDHTRIHDHVITCIRVACTCTYI